MSYEVPLVLEIEKRPCLYNFNTPDYNRKDLLDSAWTEVASVVNLTDSTPSQVPYLVEAEALLTYLHVYECKDKWKNIRSSFVRSLRTLNGGKSKKPYYLSQYLQFIVPYLKPASGDSILEESQPRQPDREFCENSEQHNTTIKIEPVELEFNSEQMILDPLNCEKEIEKPLEISGSLLKRRRQPVLMKNSLHLRNKNKRLPTTFRSVDSPRTENIAMKYFLLSLLPELDTLDEDQVRLFKIKVMMLIDEIKSDASKVKEGLPNNRENIRLQKRLINLLLRSFNKKHDSI